MRILIMVHNLTGGGAERVAALWVTGFVERGHEVGLVLSTNRADEQTYPIPDAVKRYMISSWIANKLYRKFGLEDYYIKHLRNVVEDFCPNVIIGVLLPWAEWARKATVEMNIPIINTEHNALDLPPYAPQKRKDNLVKRFKLDNQYSHVTVLTQADKNVVEGRLRHISVLPNPLAFKPASTLPKKENVILAAGRLDIWHIKGFDLLIEAWGKIAKDYPQWKLLIAGKDKNNAQSYLQTIAHKAKIGEQIVFLGFQNDLMPYYQQSSVFVLSSRYEGFGMVLIEAMSQGCAPIACDYKGRQREIITSDEEGVICPVDDVDALASAIRRMVEDETYRHNIQQNAIERSRHYCLSNIMDKWEKILNEL